MKVGNTKDSVEKRKLNLHDGHVASCLCCQHLEFKEETGPYSDVTPGDSASIMCLESVFSAVYSPDSDDMHRLQVMGQSCRKFKGK